LDTEEYDRCLEECLWEEDDIDYCEWYCRTKEPENKEDEDWDEYDYDWEDEDDDWGEEW